MIGTIWGFGSWGISSLLVRVNVRLKEVLVER